MSRHLLRRCAYAFTLLELIVVIAVIVILVALLLPMATRARASSVDVRCKANLQQIYHAQTYYAADNRGKLAGVEYRADSLWPDRLRRYFTKSETGLPGDSVHCPALDRSVYRADEPQNYLMSYGVNPAVMLPNWTARLDRKMPASELILMGDKAMTYDDWLTTDDGYYVVEPHPDPGYWIKSLGHSSYGTYRHGSRQSANMVMVDGHVATMRRADLVKESGHWYWGEPSEPIYEVNLGACCSDGGKPPH